MHVERKVHLIIFISWMGLWHVSKSQMTCNPNSYLMSVPNTGTDGGDLCVFPFTYLGQQINYCTDINSRTKIFWCATTNNYDRDERWGECPSQYPEILPTIRTIAGRRCNFPFVYKSRLFYSCTTFDSRTGSPWCSITREYREENANTCEAVAPCFDEYQRFNNSQRQGGNRLGEATSPAHCRQLCQCDPDCNGYEWQRRDEDCWVHRGTIDRTEFNRNNDVDFFLRISCENVSPTVKPHSCIDTFTRRDNTFAYGGILEQGANNEDTCKRSCLASRSCVAYDVDENFDDVECFLHYNRENLDSLMTGIPGLTHYVRVLCISLSTTIDTNNTPDVECLDDFIKQSLKHAFGGMGISGASNVESCRSECLSKTECTSFDFTTEDNVTPRCFIHFTRVDTYDTENTDHYIRMPCQRLATPSGRCQDNFQVLRDQHGYGGTLEWTIVDLDSCKIACNSDPECIALDFDRTRSECFLYSEDGYEMNLDAPGVDHLVREFTCASIMTTRRNQVTTRLGGGGGGGTCIDTFDITRNTLVYEGVQDEGSDTKDECQRRCLGDGDCVAFDFDTNDNTCWIHTNADNLVFVNNDVEGVNHYRRVKCDGTGCIETFTMTANRNRAGGEEQSSNYNEPSACESLCIQISAGNRTCYGFDFDRNLEVCFLQFKTFTPGTEEVLNVDNYKRDFNCENGGVGPTSIGPGGTGRTASCVDDFEEIENTNAWEGNEQSEIGTLEECRDKCLESSPNDDEVCYAFDFNTEDFSCWFFFVDTIEFNPQPAPGITHYQRIFRCSDGPTTPALDLCQNTFIRTEKRNALDALFVEGITAVDDCEAHCISKTDRDNEDYCWGFDFDTSDDSCWIHLFNYTLAESEAENVDNYRRRQSCTTGTPGPGSGCRDMFSVSRNSNALGGTQQGGVLTVKQCEDLCLESSEPICHGFDYNIDLSQCFLFLKEYRIDSNNRPGVDNFMRIFTCGAGTGTGATQPFCTDTFDKRDNRNGDGAEWQFGIFSVDECAGICQETSPRTDENYCRGFDYTANTSECWIHMQDYKLNPDTYEGTDSYRRILNCDRMRVTTDETCQDSFTRRASSNALDGIGQPGILSAQECQELCMQTNPAKPDENGQFCWGFDHNSDELQCWLHMNTYELIDNDAVELSNYVRNFLCVPLPETSPMVLCKDPFSIAQDSNAVEGVFEDGEFTAEECSDICRQTSPDQGPDYCRGFDYDPNNRRCWLQFKDYQTGTAPGILNYRRILQCGVFLPTDEPTTEACKDSFTPENDRNAAGGILEDGERTVEECSDVCRQTSPDTDRNYCRGFDYNVDVRRCWLHFQDYIVDRAPGVVSYRRNLDCVQVTTTTTAIPETPDPVTPVPVTPGPRPCRDQFWPTDNRRASGGTRQGGFLTVEQCSERCLLTSPDNSGTFCWGYDYVPFNGECTIHYEEFTPTTVQNGVKSYRRVFSCSDQCQNGFRRLLERNGISGEIQDGITDEITCLNFCQSQGVTGNLQCHGLDFDQHDNSCWFFRDRNYVINAGRAELVVHYTRKNC